MGCFRSSKGQAMVEFAIIIPFFLMLLYGFAYLAMFFHDYHTLQAITRDITRHEAVGIPYDTIKANYTSTTFLTDVYLFNPDTDITAVDIKTEDEKNASGTVTGKQVTVTLKATANLKPGSFWSGVLPPAITASLTMRKED